MSAFMYAKNASINALFNIWVQWGVIMEWSKGFQPERKTSWDDVANTIRSSVTMAEAVARYAPSLRPRYNRIPCPIHHGKDYNFSFTRTGYKCFVCGATGDVITFVKDTQGCATRVDAMKMLDRDFNLHLIENGDLKVSADLLSRLNEKTKQALKLQAAQDEWDKNYDELMSCFAYLDTILMHPEEYPVTVICQAKEKMAWIRWELDHMPSRPRE